MRGAQAFLVVSGLLFAACDGEVVQIGTGGAGTSSSKATSATNATATGNTSAATTQAATTAATTAASTGSGMPDCMAACDKLEPCGIPQAQCQMYLDCNQPLGQCIADCVNDPNTTCNNAMDCYQQCQGMGTTGSGMTTTSTGTGMMQTCGQCVQSGMNGCQMQLQQCFQTNAQDCQAWTQCAQACMTPNCLDTCTMQHPSGAPVQQCACTTCGTQCDAVCN
jgi:hypothetical protein